MGEISEKLKGIKVYAEGTEEKRRWTLGFFF